MNFLNISFHLLFIIILSFPTWASEPLLSDKKYKDFYQVFSDQKNQDENKVFLKYKTDWKSPQAKKQRIYNYLGVINYELRRKNYDSAYTLLTKMPAGLKYFTVEQKPIYNLIRAQVFYARQDYARTVLLLRESAYDTSNIYYNMISVLYMKSLVHLDLKFEATDYFEKNSHLFETKLNWDDYNSLVVQVSAFLIDLQQNGKALSYLKKPLLYFPLYRSGENAMQLLTRIECSGYSQGEQFHTAQNSALLEEQIFNRIGANEFAKNFILAMANVDAHSTFENENLFANLKVLVSARQYDLAKVIVDYLAKGDYKQDEVLFYKGRIYNSLNQPLVSVESYKKLIDKYPHSPLAKAAKIRYALSLQFSAQYSKSAVYVEGNSLFNNLNDGKFYEFWLYYLNKDFKKASSILTQVQSTSISDDFVYVKSTYWKSKMVPAVASLGATRDDSLEKIARLSLNYPYPVFARQPTMSSVSFHGVSEEPIHLPKSFSTFGMKPKDKFYLLSELVQAHLNEFAILQIKPLLSQTLIKEDQEKLAYYSYLVTDFTTASKLVRNLENFEVKDLEFDKLPEDKRNFYTLNYPLAYWSYVNRAAHLLNMNPFWLLSVMRAESLYDANAESPVGAVGLMQIMPYTGQRILNNLTGAEDKEIKNKFSIAMLRDPDKSIAYSAWYLKILLDNYNGNYILATAAYNAGPEAINRWIKQYPNFNTAEFFENIPYNETKKYVANILGSMDLYSRIYNNRPLVLDFDVNKSLEGLKPENLF